MTTKRLNLLLIVAICVMGVLIAKPFVVRPHGISNYIAWTNGGPGTTPYEQSAWFSNALKQEYDVIAHSRSFLTDPLMVADLLAEKSDFALLGLTGSFFAQEGLFDYAKPGTGPQALRLLLANHTPKLRTLLVRADSPIQRVAQLRGKRVARMTSRPEAQYFTLALLRYGNLSERDVVWVDASEPSIAIRMLREGKVDAAFAPTRLNTLYENDPEQKTLRYLPMPVGAGNWKAVSEVAPFFAPVSATYGYGLSEAKPVVSASYAYPVLITRVGLEAAYAQRFMELLLAVLPGRIALDPAMSGWALPASPLPLDWQIPYHEGAVALFKARGLWGEAHAAYNDALLTRQTVLAEAWHAFVADAPKDAAAFETAWLAARARALATAHLPVWVFP